VSLSLLDYRRRVFALYGAVREAGTGAPGAHGNWRAVRDELFGTHPDSALTDDDRAAFEGLAYYEYDPAYRVGAPLDTDVEQVTHTVELGADGAFEMTRIGRVSFKVPSGAGTLGVYWVEGYGGGIFIPFRDATNGETTYGGGRYLYDTIKGADLGTADGALVLDFNYAYHPSCAYNPRWVCPLAPIDNRLEIAIRAGEQLKERRV